ncbi:hypothetical protein [Anaerorhabdus furcosa]|uniref:Uncharacterized protein n=1 Tax=Anaerorhabdus furcosa TaxID=118967 RepID=A0A1T4KS41_9FIRM|nr:hypothetical protein [Anaerorhabdus furcosa]SJZ45147.1 hypothetical protein SAMN02745191_0673 [Anaerorhabdus furcosa]
MEFISLALNIIMLGLIVFFSISFVFLIKRNKKNKKIVDCITSFDEEKIFFEKLEDYLKTTTDPEFYMKGIVLNLWGSVFYRHDDEILPLLDKVQCFPLVDNRGPFKRDTAQLNEDSLYYLCLACVNALYGRKDIEKIEKFKEKINENCEYLKDTMVYHVSQHAFKLYEGKEDLGEQFFKDILDGDYSGYKYAKQLIGMYKDLCQAYLVKIYSVQNRKDDFDLIKEDVQRFYDTKLGKRYLTELGINLEWLNHTEKDN